MVVWGNLATATHAEPARLYHEHAKGVLGESYLSEAVIVTDRAGRVRPALVSVAPAMQPRAAEEAYVERIASPAERFGLRGVLAGSSCERAACACSAGLVERSGREQRQGARPHMRLVQLRPSTSSSRVRPASESSKVNSGGIGARGWIACS
jgi:hypothetical protein